MLYPELQRMGPNESAAKTRSLISCRLGDITLDPARRTVRRGAADIQLGKLTYELLLMLIEAAPRVVTQEPVAERLWNDRHVTQDTVRQRVKLLPKALDDDAEDPRYFNVVRGQGYRLIPDVKTVPVEPAPPVWPGRRSLVAGITIFMALASVYWVASSTSPTPDISTQSSPATKSIAVLPFENLTGNVDDAYFVDGFHNDLLTQLAKIGNFKIISRTSVIE